MGYLLFLASKFFDASVQFCLDSLDFFPLFLNLLFLFFVLIGDQLAELVQGNCLVTHERGDLKLVGQARQRLLKRIIDHIF